MPARGRTAIVLLGDYIDRGPESRAVIRRLRRLTEQRPGEVICLMGNHEDMLLSAIEKPSDVNWWLDNGGDATLASYGVSSIKDLPADDIEWIRNLPLFHDDGLRFFVHAGIDPIAPFDRQDRFTMLWTRKRHSDELDLGRFVVHGHTPLRSEFPEQRSLPAQSRHRRGIRRAAVGRGLHGRPGGAGCAAGRGQGFQRKQRARIGHHSNRIPDVIHPAC